MIRQHRAIRQEVSDRIFAPIQSLENEGILYVFLVFQTEEVGQKGGGDSQIQLCGVAIKYGGSGRLVCPGPSGNAPQKITLKNEVSYK